MILDKLAAKGAIWACVALGIICVVLAVALWLQQAALKVCDATREAQKIEIGGLRDSIAAHQRTIAEQNAAVESLKASADKRQAEASQALAKARSYAARSEDSRRQLAALLGAPAPSGADCRRAVSELRKGLGR